MERLKLMQGGEAGQVIYYLPSKLFVVIISPPYFLLETDVNHFTGAFLKKLLSIPVPPSALYMQRFVSLSYFEK